MTFIKYLSTILIPFCLCGCDLFSDPDVMQLDLVISADSDSFSLQNPLTITVDLQNNGEKTFELVSPFSCALESSVYIDDEQYLILNERIWTEDMLILELSPGDNYSESWTWDGKYLSDSGAVFLTPGVYTIKGAKFVGTDNFDYDFNTIEVTYQ